MTAVTAPEQAAPTGVDANQQALQLAIAELKSLLELRASDGATRPLLLPVGGASASASQLTVAVPTLDRMSAAFRLSPFERGLLLLCAAVELDSSVGELCAKAQGDPRALQPSFGFALGALPQPHWSAISPASALRRWHLLEIGSGSTLVSSTLRLDERILNYLLGVHHIDAALVPYVHTVPVSPLAAASHQALARKVQTLWVEAANAGAGVPPVQIAGGDAATRRDLAAAICQALKLSVLLVPAELLPAGPMDLDKLRRQLERESLLSVAAIVFDCDELDASDPTRWAAMQSVIERVNRPMLILTRDRQSLRRKSTVTFELAALSFAEQHSMWAAALGADAAGLNGALAGLAMQFALAPQAIRAASAQARSGIGPAGAADATLSASLWEACRLQARAKLDDLAFRIDSPATWDDLILPELQRRTLHDVVTHVRQRAKVYEAWGFGSRGKRGLGISALFAGASGVGKTLAAEVIANELHLDLYRVDLSSTVSKFIGETEKNLRRIFDAAEEGGAVLLFDEADALFGKRSEVKDSHDRYANIEVSYLLQRMESYRGLAVLTTNLKSSLDPAFLRRIRFIVHFPFPDVRQRGDIWRRAFPAATPTNKLDIAKLARLNVAGGNIKNIAMGAAFIAADEDRPVGMGHVLAAARAEYAKLEKSLTPAEIEGWV